MNIKTSTRGESGLPRWFQSVFAVLKGIEAGRIDVSLPDGRMFRVEGAEDGPAARIDVRNGAICSRLVRDGEVGFAEAYMEGWWDTPDLQAVMDVMLRNNAQIARQMPGMALVRTYEKARHWLRANTRQQAQRNISYHYDLGNEFYRRWLDSSMTYSSAIFRTPDDDLPTAQAQKYASICDKIGLVPGQHVLEIGCGWGGFAEYATRERGAKVTALTISRAQHDFAKERLFRAGLSERADVIMRDYRDETGQYDGIASIEMFEAVGERYWPTYFDTLRDRLRPGASAALQIITVEDSLFEGYRKSVDFIQKYIFPGGMLPSPAALDRQIARAGLARTGSIEFGQCYSETLRRWHRSFNIAWDDIQAMGFDERFRRMWNYYLTSCAACFLTGTTDVTQVSVQRPH